MKTLLKNKIFRLVGGIAIFGVLILIILSVVTGHGINLRSFGRYVKSLLYAIRDREEIKSNSQGDFTNIIFVHQSVGRNLIRDGNVREKFIEAGYQFTDHDYNSWGLFGPDGNFMNYHYNIPGDNTYPDALAAVFNQPYFDYPLNAFSSLMQYEVLIFKSCYPTSDIESDEKLDQYKAWYREIRAVADQHPDHIFIFLTQPPLNPADTDLESAARAAEFAQWVQSDEFLSGHSNIYVFDFFGLLIEKDSASPEYNMLRVDYRDSQDSHPTPNANEAIAPKFVDFVIKSIENYRTIYDPTQ